MCPLARKPHRTSSSASRFPTTARSTSSSTWAESSWTRSSCTSDPLQRLDHLRQLGERHPLGETPRRRRSVGPHQLPGRVAENPPRRAGIGVGRDSPPYFEDVVCERAKPRAQSMVRVERAEEDFLLESRQRVRRFPTNGRAPTAGPAEGSRRRKPAQQPQGEKECVAAEQEGI